MKKICICVLAFLSFNAFSQTVNDPNDQIYRDIDMWFDAGYIREIPMTRPYPSQVVITLLDEVIAKGNDRSITKATEYKAFLQKDFGMTYFNYSKLETGEAGAMGYSLHGGQFFGYFNELTSISARIGAAGIHKTNGYRKPTLINDGTDFLSDWSDIGSILIRQSAISTLAFGNDISYVQAGVNRSAFGPFYEDGGVLSSHAPHHGFFNYTWRNELITYSNSLLVLAATTNEGKRAGLQELPEKYINNHSIEFTILDNLKIGFFETNIYGKSFKPMYLIPTMSLFYTQGLVGFTDNSLLGFTGQLRLPQNLGLKGMVIVDDLHFNDLVRFKFDTKYKLALQAGVSWTPMQEFLNSIDASYFAVMPYMYSHPGPDPAITSRYATPIEPTTMNYTNFTHQGSNIATVLHPNSDRFRIVFRGEPISNLNYSFENSFVRHGNPTANGNPQEGTIFDDGYDNTGKATFQDRTPFLSQSVLEYTLLNKLAVTYLIDSDYGTFDLSCSYGIQTQWNKELVEGQNEMHHLLSFSLGYRL